MKPSLTTEAVCDVPGFSQLFKETESIRDIFYIYLCVYIHTHTHTHTHTHMKKVYLEEFSFLFMQA